MNNPGHIAAAAVDRLLIRELIDQYFFAVDRRDWDLLGNCFREDARFSLFDGQITMNSRREIVEQLKNIARYAASHHGASNVVIKLSDTGATACTHATAFLHKSTADDSKMLVRGLRYEDSYVRDGDGWKIVKRAHIPVWQFDVDAVESSILKGRTFQG